MTRRELLLSTAALPALAAEPMVLAANTAMLGFSLTQAIDACANLGFAGIEIQPMGVPAATPGKFPGFRFDQLSAASRGDIARRLQRFARITSHLPYTGWNWASADPDERRRSEAAVEEAMRGSGHFGAKAAVLHAAPVPGNDPGDPPLPETYLDRIRTWGTRAQKLGFRIAIETGYPRSVAAFTAFLRAIDHPNVGATLDVGHQKSYRELTARVKPEDRATPAGIRAYNDTNIELVEKLGPKLFNLHIHDIEPSTWNEHKPLIHGFVDYPRLIAALRKVRYAGSLVFEIGGPGEEIEQSLRVAKQKLEGWLA